MASSSPVNHNEDEQETRLELKIMPGVPSGIISASKSPSQEDEAAVAAQKIRREECGLSEFFEAGDEGDIAIDAEKYVILEDVLDVFADTSNLELTLRDAVFKELQKHKDLRFPKNADNNGKYKEEDLKNLFQQFGEEFGEPNVTMQPKEPGLLVNTASSPDMCVLRNHAADGKIEANFAELKNDKDYTIGMALNRCFLYLHSLLYFFRVKLGIPMETVYGLILCGPKCKGINNTEYAVGLLKLTAPQRLGQSFVGAYWCENFKIDSSQGLQVLVHFLSAGKQSDLGAALSDCREKTKRAPCLFAVPRSLWKDDTDSRKLMLGGTCAIVFRVSFQQLDYFLENAARPQDWKWNLFRAQVRRWKDNASQRASTTPQFIYVKVRTKDTTTHFDPNFFSNEFIELKEELKEKTESDSNVSESLEDFFKTYIVRPYG